MKFFLVLIGLVLYLNYSLEADWPQWRGVSGQGSVEGEEGVPIKWSEKENVKWRYKNKHKDTMNLIKVDDVIRKIDRLLGFGEIN